MFYLINIPRMSGNRQPVGTVSPKDGRGLAAAWGPSRRETGRRPTSVLHSHGSKRVNSARWTPKQASSNEIIFSKETRGPESSSPTRMSYFRLCQQVLSPRQVGVPSVAGSGTRVDPPWLLPPQQGRNGSCSLRDSVSVKYSGEI